MKNFFTITVLLAAAIFIWTRFPDEKDTGKEVVAGPQEAETSRQINGTIENGETFFEVFIAEDNRIDSLSYWIDDDGILEVTRKDQVFSAVRTPIEYEKRLEHIGGFQEIQKTDGHTACINHSSFFCNVGKNEG